MNFTSEREHLGSANHGYQNQYRDDTGDSRFPERSDQLEDHHRHPFLAMNDPLCKSLTKEAPSDSRTLYSFRCFKIHCWNEVCRSYKSDTCEMGHRMTLKHLPQNSSQEMHSGFCVSQSCSTHIFFISLALEVVYDLITRHTFGELPGKFLYELSNLFGALKYGYRSSLFFIFFVFKDIVGYHGFCKTERIKSSLVREEKAEKFIVLRVIFVHLKRPLGSRMLARLRLFL